MLLPVSMPLVHTATPFAVHQLAIWQVDKGFYADSKGVEHAMHTSVKTSGTRVDLVEALGMSMFYASCFPSARIVSCKG
jgi:hypothetical protein